MSPQAQTLDDLMTAHGAIVTPKSETTRLSSTEEQRFQSWVKRNRITDVDDPQSFYDYRGYWKETGDKPIRFGVDHFTDTYKQHGHPTFSVESKYSKGANDGGRWEGETYIKPTSAAADPLDALMSQHGAIVPDFTSTNQKDASGNATAASSIGTFVRHVGAQINPVAAVQSLGRAVLHPVDTVKGIGAAQGALYDKAKASYEQGDYGTAARHFVDYLLPLVGPAIDQSADQIQRGNIAAGAGDAVGIGLSMFGPKAIGQAAATRAARPATPPPSNPQAGAVAFGRQRGIPVDAATATNNMGVRGVQAMADRSIAGSIVAAKAGDRQAAALVRVGGELADTARGVAVTTEQAGQGITEALTSKLQAHNALADRSYGTLRALEAANPEKFYINLTAEKAALKPIYLRLKREAELVPLQGDKARALTALDRLINGYKADVPLSIVEEALGDLKSMARADVPELRTQGQGAAAAAVTQLDRAVRQTATRAGPNAIRALETGRGATVAKYQTADVLDALRAEPVGTFRQMTAPKDSGIALLRAVKEQAPQTMPQIARAKLDELLAVATEKGGFEHADKLYAEWQKIGPETKRLLFPKPAEAQALDHFFLLAKKLATNPNPSGTGQAVMRLSEGGALFTNPLVFIVAEAGAAGLSAILHAPRGVPVLTRATSNALRPQIVTAAQRAATAAELLRVAESAGVRLTLPAGASTEPRR